MVILLIYIDDMVNIESHEEEIILTHAKTKGSYADSPRTTFQYNQPLKMPNPSRFLAYIHIIHDANG